MSISENIKRKCTNCDRFPFCDYQEYCIYNSQDLTKSYLDYWIKRQDKNITKI